MSGATRLMLLEYQPVQQLKQQPPALPSASRKQADLTLQRAVTSYTLALPGQLKQRQPQPQPPTRPSVPTLPRRSTKTPCPAPEPSRPGAVSTTSKSLLMRQQTSNDLFKLTSSRMRRSTAAARVAPGYWAMDSAGAWEAEERAQQRRRIYALNKLMTELEEENYLAFKSSQQRAG
ncbi:hypothetical protein BOX15_Mlig024393g4 [Macrostomum lignano]|uniref:Uncharacterized protein n=1 Tax=Macrostomum lignano TaxID=282301 RepID=A0A267FP68_9PLAT|nr:hypothetical protein BOX15_Mlig024393g4 [Macrostomum lignano]